MLVCRNSLARAGEEHIYPPFSQHAHQRNSTRWVKGDALKRAIHSPKWAKVPPRFSLPHQTATASIKLTSHKAQRARLGNIVVIVRANGAVFDIREAEQAGQSDLKSEAVYFFFPSRLEYG